MLQLQQMVALQTENSSSYTKVFRDIHVLKSFIAQLIYLHQYESCTFLQMYYISLKQREIVFTRLAGMLGMFTQGVCGTMISTCCGALLHRHIIVTRMESFNTSTPKVTLDHIKLSSFGKMNVSLAIQVFSKSMANTLRFFHPDGQADELARFTEMVTNFFDMANTRSTTEHKHKTKTQT